MAHAWKCDICAKDTYVNPPHRYETEEVEADLPEGLKALGVPVAKTTRYVTVPLRRQNPLTGEMETVQVPKTIDLAPRAHIVRLSIGHHEVIQRDFCQDCLQKVMPEIRSLWAKLEEITPQ